MKKILSTAFFFTLLLLAAGVKAQTLIHYWNFDNIGDVQVFKNPNMPAFKADWSAIDTNKAKIVYTLIPTAPPDYSGYIDGVGDLDTVNLRREVFHKDSSFFGFRVRNPTDSMELHLYIPTTGFHNIVVKYALQSSSTKSGMLTQLYDYSTDGGTTWKKTDLTVNGAASSQLDVTQTQYQNAATFGLVTLTFGTDKSVEDNPNLVLRIRFDGNTTGGKGNNRFDNLTVESATFIKPPPVTITVTKPYAGQILVPGRHAAISIIAATGVASSRTIEYSDGGSSWKQVGTMEGTSAFDWVVPNLPFTLNGLIRVTDANDTAGISDKFVLYPIDKRKNTLVHYWHFNAMPASLKLPNIPAVPSDFSANENAQGQLLYVLNPLASNTYPGSIGNILGDTTNSRLNEIGGTALRVNNKTDSMELRFAIPTTNFKNIRLSYALQASSTTSGQLSQLFDYSTDGGTTWKNKSNGMTVNGMNIDTLDVTQPQYQGKSWGTVAITLGDKSVEDNANLIFRMKFGGNSSNTSGNNRIDNFIVEGETTLSLVSEKNTSESQCRVYPNPATDRVFIQAPSERLKQITICDALGSIVFSETTSLMSLPVALSEFASGVYTVHSTDLLTHEESRIKFIKE